MPSPHHMILGVLIPQALVCAAAVIFLRRTRSVGAIILVTGITMSLVAYVSALVFPHLNQHDGLTGASPAIWWTLHRGFFYLGTNLYAVGLLMFACRSNPPTQHRTGKLITAKTLKVALIVCFGLFILVMSGHEIVCGLRGQTGSCRLTMPWQRVGFGCTCLLMGLMMLGVYIQARKKTKREAEQGIARRSGSPPA